MAVNNDKQFEIIEESVDGATVCVCRTYSRRARATQIQTSWASANSVAANYINVRSYVT